MNFDVNGKTNDIGTFKGFCIKRKVSFIGYFWPLLCSLFIYLFYSELF